MIQKKHFSVIKFLSAAAFIFLLLPSCRDDFESKKKQQYIDSLVGGLRLTDQLLEIDPADLQKRIAAIDSWYPKIKDTVPEIAVKLSDEFTALKSVFKNYLDHYYVYSSAHRLNHEEVRQFNEQKETMPREEFKKKYAELKIAIDDNFFNLSKYADPVFSVEANFFRLEEIYGIVSKE